MVIPVYLELGYEFTVFSRAIVANARKNRGSIEGKGTSYDTYIDYGTECTTVYSGPGFCSRLW
jgi:hypothetical protein